MSFKELLDSWRAGAAPARAPRRYAVRLAVDDAARLAALAEMFPGRAPEQLITELLGEALREIAATMPYVAGKRVISTDEQGDPVYEDVGPAFLADETVTLAVVKPLDLSLKSCHLRSSLALL